MYVYCHARMATVYPSGSVVEIGAAAMSQGGRRPVVRFWGECDGVVTGVT